MEDIKAIILSRFDCSEQDAVHIISKLDTLDSTLVPVLKCWIKDIDYSNSDEYSGYSVASLQQDYGMNFIAALLTIDWIIKDPQQAIPALQDGIM